MNTLTHSFDIRCKQLSRDYLHCEALLLDTLMEMRDQKVFADLNVTGIFDYCHRILKLSKAQAYYFKSVAEAARQVPELKEAVMEGELSLSQARRVAPVIDQTNHQEWIDKAKTLSQTDLEKKVSEANPKSHTTPGRIKPISKNTSELKVSIDDKTEQDLKALLDIVSQKLGRSATLSDVVSFAAKVAREKFDPEERAKRARKSSSGNSSKRARKSSSGNSSKKGRHPIPASVKHEVIRRDGFQCSHKGKDGTRCLEKRWLSLHHIRSVARGGANTADNLTFKCFLHHQAIHVSGLNPGSVS